MRTARQMATQAGARALGQERQREQEGAACQGDDAQPDMDGKAEREEHRRPGHVQDRRDAAAGEEAADLIEVAQRLKGLPGDARPEPERDDSFVHRRVEVMVHGQRRAAGDPAADEIERALERVGDDQHRGQGDQCRHAAACKDPVVDLQHVKGACEHQDVHRGGKHRHADERAAEVRERGFQRRVRRGSAHSLQVSLSVTDVMFCAERVPSDDAARAISMSALASYCDGCAAAPRFKT